MLFFSGPRLTRLRGLRLFCATLKVSVHSQHTRLTTTATTHRTRTHSLTTTLIFSRAPQRPTLKWPYINTSYVGNTVAFEAQAYDFALDKKASPSCLKEIIIAYYPRCLFQTADCCASVTNKYLVVRRRVTEDGTRVSIERTTRRSSIRVGFDRVA